MVQLFLHLTNNWQFIYIFRWLNQYLQWMYSLNKFIWMNHQVKLLLYNIYYFENVVVVYTVESKKATLVGNAPSSIKFFWDVMLPVVTPATPKQVPPLYNPFMVHMWTLKRIHAGVNFLCIKAREFSKQHSLTLLCFTHNKLVAFVTPLNYEAWIKTPDSLVLNY